MKQSQIIINNNIINLYALYYVSNNNYYIIYTDGEVDENSFIVLHVAKILQEVVNTQSGPQTTGYLIGTTIASDEEYDLVKQDIANIIDSKQNNVETTVHYIDPSTLGQLKIRDTKIFRLKKNIFEQVFGENIAKEDPNDNQSRVSRSANNEFEQKYQQELEKNKQLVVEVDELIAKLNSIKSMLQ